MKEKKLSGKILLLGERSFIIDLSQKKFSTNYGEIDLTKIKKYGQVVKTNTGKQFVALKPSIQDLLRKAKRMPQIITAKDAGQIIAYTGLRSGWHCLDAGAGSGFLAIMLGNIVAPDGSVTTYEKNKKFYENVKRNIEFCGLSSTIKIKNKPALGFTERNLDLITLDMIEAEKMIKKCHKALKPGAWLAVYSPHIEQQKRVLKEIEKSNFAQARTMQTQQIDWQVSDFSHPRPSQLVHTGFITFARKKF